MGKQHSSQAPPPRTARAAAVPFSQHLLKVTEYSQEENEAIVARFEGLRVTDVVDGLDEVGLQDVTLMDQGIHPLWRDERQFTHRICGVAVTARLVPAQEAPPVFATGEEQRRWRAEWGRRFPRPRHSSFLKRGTILVVDASRGRDVGWCGSENSYGWFLNGMRGIVIDGGCRDTDELILERIPVYERAPTRGTYPGRMVGESWNAPVNVGGVLVMPNDIIVADGGGVAVVPRARAEAVAAAAHRIQDADKIARRRHYDRAGKAADFTLE